MEKRDSFKCFTVNSFLKKNYSNLPGFLWTPVPFLSFAVSLVLDVAAVMGKAWVDCWTLSLSEFSRCWWKAFSTAAGVTSLVNCSPVGDGDFCCESDTAAGPGTSTETGLSTFCKTSSPSYCLHHHFKVVYFLFLYDPVQVIESIKQSTCIARCIVQTTLKRSGMDHTIFNLQRTPCMPLPHKRSLDGASTKCGGEHLIAAHYSFIDPERMKGWVGLVGWPIADDLPT